MQMLCRTVVKRDILCCNPVELHNDVVTPATQAHHIIGIAIDPSLAFNMKNMVGLCEQCHQEVERLVQKGFPTERLFSGEAPVSYKVCKSQNNGFYCSRMKSFRSTKCAGCTL